MQGGHLHHLQQQQQHLAALLSAALPPATTATTTTPSPPSTAADPSSSDSSPGSDDSARVAALDSLQRAILHPANSLLLSHAAPFLSQGFSQLLSTDKSYAVRRAAAVAYGSLCAVLASTGGLVDRFISWALPLLGDNGVRTGSAELALESLKEFLNSGDASAVERFVPSILKACQELLEDERTSLSLLRNLLGILTLISLKFGHCFQPHFIDIVDVLLGWAFVPGLSESDRDMITDSFLQFQSHWLSNLNFSLGLLSKFLGDMEVLVQDLNLETGQQLGRLLALFNCFSKVLQVTASGMMEMNLLEQISEPIESMAPRLLKLILMFGYKFGWSKWIGESWRCLILLAEIMREKFSGFYSMAIDIFFQSLRGLSSSHVHGLLKSNLQLLSMQNLGMLSSSVQSLLKFESPLSQLRMHPNHSVVASVAATYLFFLQHSSAAIVSQAICSLMEELELLTGLLENMRQGAGSQFSTDIVFCKKYSEPELLSLIKFDLKMLLCSVSVGPAYSCPDQTVTITTRYERSTRLTSFILEKLDPFQFPIHGCLELQVHVIRALHKLSETEFLSRLACPEQCLVSASDDLVGENQGASGTKGGNSILTIEFLRKYSVCIARALNASSAFSVKLEALDWICTFGWEVVNMNKDVDFIPSFCEPCRDTHIGCNLLILILDAAYNREMKVRFQVASVLEVLLQASLVYPGNFSFVSEVALDKLSDPDTSVRNAYARVLSIVLPLTIYACGFAKDRCGFCNLGPAITGNRCYMKWKQVLGIKQSSRKLHSQQFVSILSYISQRWKVPLSSWIQRLVFSCRDRKDFSPVQHEKSANLGADIVWKDAKLEGAILDELCPVNNLAAIWWSIHEAARHCITLRLRTNLGGPTQTFAALERMLLDIPNVLQLDTEQSEGKYIASSNFHLLPMRLLLEFVEALKKNVYNAYEGSSVLPCSTRQSSLFFRANKKVCEEWFARICDPMMNAGLALHCHDATLNYCMLRLQDLRNLVASTFKEKNRDMSENLHSLRVRLGGDVLKVLRHASLALCRSHEPEALAGLQKWAAMTFSTLFINDNKVNPGLYECSMVFSWMNGLVYQAQGQYEKAAAHFSHLLQSEEALSSMDSDGIQFVIARIIESYTSLSDWKSLESWLSELQALRAAHAGRAYSGALTAAGNELNAIHALARFDEGDIHAAWNYLDLTPKTSSELTLDPKLALERSEQMLLRSMLQRGGQADKVLEDLKKATLMLDEPLSVISLDGLNEAASCATQLHCIFAFEEGTRFSSQDEAKQLLARSLDQVLCTPISRIQQDTSLWIKIFRVYRTVLPTSSVTLRLGQKLLSLARKQKNFILANRMKKYLREHLPTCDDGIHKEILSANLQYESILLRYIEGSYEEALIDLWSLVRPNVMSTNSFASDSGAALQAKACLKLSTWLRQENPNINPRNVSLRIYEDFSTCDALDGSSFTKSGGSSVGDRIYDNWIFEEIVGIATKGSCHLCPTLGKAWLSYATWCFSQAKDPLPAHRAVLQSSSVSPVLYPEVSPDRFQLTEEEMSRVEIIITKICQGNVLIQSELNEEYLDSFPHPKSEALVKSLVQQTAYLMQTAAGAPGFEASDGKCPSVALSSQLLVLFHCLNTDMKNGDLTSYVDKLVDIWWSLRRRRVSLFGHAAKGYFQYLSLSSSKLQDNNFVSFHLDVVNEKTKSCTLKAMLYVLHILLNYGDELRETLERGFATVPLLPWQEITPQLFSRLSSHPKGAVRKQLEGLLIMLAKFSPWSIVYPLLVDINAYEGNPSEELQRILDCLVKLYPKLVQDTQLVINSLATITVLWEEQWLSTLQDLHADVVRRINMLKDEATRIAENITLSHTEKNKISAAKYSAMMAPIIVALERRLASTSREPETAHETWFHKEYGEQLKSAILAFKTPPVSPAALGDVWRPFDAIAACLATCQKKSSIYLGDVAPQLASLSSSEVPMPGLEKQISSIDSYKSTADVQGIITISSFREEVAVLSTKTKPKKLVLLGSDGQKYTYLLKGREDLRLDARIMQLLQAVNSFLNSCNKTRSRSLAIRYYSVTPISGRAGLIQWVDNVTSIYSVYKSWQNRAQLSQLSATGAGLSSPLPPVPRPSDMFYGKIIPALKEKGIRRVISRRDWPREVKRKVLLELMKETPRQLLWQEMWCASEGFRAFNLKTKRFSGSVASMSIVGHVLGLGDRHLDNILMDFCSGDVIHIDYNVCFDKGRRLKIPEIVPFRLTQTIETALGLTGVEGTFRANCEAIFDILRKNKDIILMLLEVFIWDPLVEWARGDNDEAAIGGEEKKGMELAVSLSLFASRFQEIRVPLQEHHDLLVSALPSAESSLKKFLDVLNQYEVISSIFYLADKERTSLLQHEASAKSIAAEATSISEKCRQSFEVQAQEFAQAKSVATEKAQEAAMWVDQHGRVLEALRTGSIPDAQACFRLSSMEEAVSLTSAVLVSGVPLTIVPEPTQAQCYDLDREVSHLITELENGLSGAIEGLQEYALTLQRVLPLNYVTTSPVNSWAQVLQLSVNNLSADILSLARRQAADIIAKAQGDGLDSVQQRHRDLFHNMERYAIEIEKVDDECSELMRSIGSDAEAKSKERLLSAFTKYMHSAGYSCKEDHHFTTRSGQNKLDGSKDFRWQGDVEEKKVKVLSILRMVANELYKEVKDEVISMCNISSGRTGWRLGDVGFRSDSGVAISDFEEKIEKCALIAGFVDEVQELIGIDLASINFGADSLSFERNWAPVFQASLRSGRHLIEELTVVVLPEIIRSFVSYNSEVMEAFGSLSQIRGTVDTTLEKLVEVELEKASLVELEKNYFVKVGLITEQQLALEEAAVKGRDNLSWEEAEELATQEEACRAQLAQLHQSWNQKDVRSTSLTKIEANVRNSLTSLERHFSSLVSNEQDGDMHIRSSKALIAALVKPFSELESVDQMLSAYGTLPSHLFGSSFGQAEFITSNSSLYESTWRFSDFLKNHSFFTWKVGILDSILDLCMHDISSSVDRNFSFDQLYNVLKKKIEVHLQEHVGQYLIDRVAPALLAQLERENESLHQMIATREDLVPDQVRNDSGALRRVQHMLEEYCNSHETARAARSAISVMKRQLSGLTEALCKTILEIVQMEWIHELSLPHLLKTKVLSPKILGDDKFSLIVRNLSRPKLLEKIQSSMSSIARSLEALQICERTSVSAEGQLERAMGWACAGSGTVRADTSSTRNSGIPSEFHEHLLRRRQILWAAREQASDVIKICTSVMEFEASRDGLFRTSEEKSSGWTSGDGRAWQQAYLNTLTILDVSYHSFTCAEQEWKLARNNMEIASNSLLSATKELHVASVKAKSASGDLQNTLATLRDCAFEASVALSAFGRVSKGHTALTSECGSMLEEVLVITEGLHDIHSLAKEAAAAHHALMADLSKANMILLPLEASLSTDVTALGDAIQKEQESNADVSPIHGQALYQSYCLRIREACQSLASLVPSLTYSVEALHSMLTNLARASSTHAGNLHKALEGLGDSQVVRSQDLALSRSEISDGELLFDEKRFVQSNEGSIEDLATVGEFSLEDEDWISPPDHSYTSSSDFSITSTEASLSETSDGVGKVPHSIDFREDSFTDDHGQERIYAEEQEPDFTAGNANGATISLPSDSSESMQVLSSHVATAARVNHSSNKMENISTEEEKSLCCKIDLGSLKLDKGDSGSHNESSDLNPESQITRGKNAYALSVLRQVERKLDGRDIEEMSSMNISELVDHLLKQATSLDNLCNMYEGWTPWI